MALSGDGVTIGQRQPKAPAPGDDEVHDARYEVLARPFEWKFTRADLARLLERLAARAVSLPEAA